MPRLMRVVKPKLSDLTSLLRPWFILPSVFALLSGVILGLHQSGASMKGGAVAAGLLLVGPLIAGSSIVFNQVTDLASDSKSYAKRRFPLVRMRLSVRTAYILSFVLLAGGIAVSSFLGPIVLVATIIAAALAFAYSHPRTRLKDMPLVGCIVSSACYGILPVIVGWSLVASLKAVTFIIGLPLFVVFSSGYMLLCLPDARDGVLGGKAAMVAMRGQEGTVKASILLIGLSGLLVLIFSLTGVYPSSALIVLPVLVSIMAMHWRLPESANLEQTFMQLRYLYLVLGIIFLAALTM